MKTVLQVKLLPGKIQYAALKDTMRVFNEDSDGESFSGKTVENTRRRYHTLRKNLQSCGSRSTRRHWQRIRHKESRFRRNQNHVIAKKLVEKAKDTERGIALENLRHIRERTAVRKSDRAKYSSGSFFQLQSLIEYKAKLQGVPVQYVDPHHTSRQCASCGHTEKANRKTQSRFQCVCCGHIANADQSAAINIAARATVNQPIVAHDDNNGGFECRRKSRLLGRGH